MLETINFRQVQAFRTVMLTGQITTAAELMGITQPAVSRLVRDFEYATRLALFVRRGNQILPTQAAKTLMAEVERAFSGLNRVQVLADAIRRQSAGILRIAATPALAINVLPQVVASFLKDRPGLHISLNGLNSPMVIEAVASGHADIGYADGPIDRPGFEVLSYPMDAIVALPAGHRLAAQDIVEPADLINERIIALDPGTISAMRVEVALAGIARGAQIETKLTHTACALVAEGVGLTLADPLSAGEFIDRGLCIRPFSLSVDAGFQCIRLAASAPSNIVADFMDEAISCMDSRVREAISCMDSRVREATNHRDLQLT